MIAPHYRGLAVTYDLDHAGSRTSKLPGFLDQRIDREASVGIACRAYRNSRRNLVLTLDGLALRRLDVARKCDEEIARDALLHRNARARRSLGITTRQHWVDGELRDAGGLRKATGNLARDLICHKRFSCLVSGHRIGSAGYRRLSKGEQMNDVRRWQRRVRCILRAQLIDRTIEPEIDVVLLDGCGQREVYYWLGDRWIDKLNRPAREDKSISIQNDVATGKIGAP